MLDEEALIYSVVSEGNFQKSLLIRLSKDLPKEKKRAQTRKL